MPAMDKTHAVGKDCKLYYNSAATRAAATWVEIKKAINVTLNMSKGEADASCRETSWKLQRGALKELEITFSYRYLKGGADTVVDGDIVNTGANGMKVICEVFGMNVSQELESTQEIEFTIKPAYKEETGAFVPPAWFET
jgi:hypothetical protein